MLASKFNNPVIISPKPYVPNKPTLQNKNNDEDNTNQAHNKIVPQINAADLSKTRLKKTTSPTIIANEQSNENNENIPEFLRRNLKPPAQRRAEAENKANDKPILTAKPSKPLVKPPKPNIAPKSSSPQITKPPRLFDKPQEKLQIPEKITDSPDQKKSKTYDDNNNPKMSEEDADGMRKIRVGSVHSGKLFFEKIDQKVQDEVVVPKKPIAMPRTQNNKNIQNQNNSHEKKTHSSKGICLDSSNAKLAFDNTNKVAPDIIKNSSINNKNVFSDDSRNETEEELYDDVDGVLNNTTNQENSDLYEVDEQTTSGKTVEFDLYEVDEQTTSGKTVEFDLYEVDETLNSKVQTSNIDASTKNEVATEQELYDDISDNKQTSQQPPYQEELYDDVADILKNDQAIRQNSENITEVENSLVTSNTSPSTELIEESLYNDVEDQSNQSKLTNQLPHKPPRDFKVLPSERLIVPHGLENWLSSMIKKNLFKTPSVCRDNKPLGKVDHLIQEDTYDPVNDEERSEILNRTSSNANKIVRKPAGTIKKTKEEKNREKLERKEREEKEKREKNERKKKEKEYKKFNLPINETLTLGGTLSCKQNYKAQNKFDLSYLEGEDVNIIECPKCPKDKFLVQHSTNGKIGYVSRQDFGIADDSPDLEETRRCTPSPIPTDSEEEELYDEINCCDPPPIPATPRPTIAPESRPPIPPPSPRPLANINLLAAAQIQPRPLMEVPPPRPSVDTVTPRTSIADPIPTEDEIYDDIDQVDSMATSPVTPIIDHQDFGDLYDDVAANVAKDIEEEDMYVIAT